MPSCHGEGNLRQHEYWVIVVRQRPRVGPSRVKWIFESRQPIDIPLGHNEDCCANEDRANVHELDFLGSSIIAPRLPKHSEVGNERLDEENRGDPCKSR